MGWLLNLLGIGKVDRYRGVADDGFIHIQCECGKTMKVPPDSRGKKAKCKKCLRQHVV